MNKIVVIDNREEFCKDISIYADLEDDLEVSLLTISKQENMSTTIGNTPIAGIVVADNVFQNNSMDEAIINSLLGYGVPIFGYLTKETSMTDFKALNLPCIGLAKKASQIVKMIDQKFNVMPVSTPKPTPTPTPTPVAPTPPPIQQPTQQVQQPIYYGNQEMPVQYPQQPLYNSPVYQQPNQEHYSGAPVYQQTGTPAYQQPPVYPTMPGVAPQPIQHQYEQHQTQVNFKERETQMYDEMINRDIRGNAKRNTKVVTVYSAKGGVGKTTIAAELSSYLSLTCRGRGKTRVCLIDYNIDFGDIRTTLGFHPSDVNMSLWASVIKEKMDHGEDKDTMTFTQNEMETTYLKAKKFTSDTEFYTLLAPANHIDSMDITETQLSVMLRNIIENGNFDYVICDTGNNTRDSAILALDYADYIFLVVTQDVTTTNCNDSFISTMREMHFDESKIRLVINNIVSARDTGISVSDIEEYVKYPCIARIKHNTDVIKANNNGSPLVFLSNHEFTKELRKIVAFLTGNEIDVETPKKSFLSKLFKK